jgi:23S rRNA pseudouridine1911/1915/1917 synthase
VIRLTVEAPGGERIDAYLARVVPELSRSQAAQLIANGHVRLNGALPRKSEKPTVGDVLEVELPEPKPSTIEPEELPLEIVYEDSDLLVVDKAAGVVVHPGAGHNSSTLVNALLHHVKDLSGVGGVLRPGIVHRLDKDTSGLLIVAKHDQAHRAVSAALKRREVRRVYLVAAWGHLQQDEVVVDAPIGRSPHHRKRMAVITRGRPARTRFRRLERWRGADLLRAELDTGRTHQIRVHLLSIGHPVVGDHVYAPGILKGMGGPAQGWNRELNRRTPRQFLHAGWLEFKHPSTGEILKFESPLPGELADVAEWARSTS